MLPLFSAAGEAAMRGIMPRRPLLALDFDGTLAPIVALPADACAPPEIARLLTRLGCYMPVAIVSGRSVADVAGRLGFAPRFIVGNHGAEGLPGLKPAVPDLDAWRRRIEVEAVLLLDAGISVEDKGHSFSLHYRHAPDPERALARIHALVGSLSPAPRLIGGKCVVNLLPVDAPDKFCAIRTLLRVVDGDVAIFAGDDLTDEVVFAQAPADWLTVRVEAMPGSRARFCVERQAEVVRFLCHLLELAETAAGTR